MSSSSVSKTLSITAMTGCLALAVPAALMGIVARATDWYLVEGYNQTMSIDNGNAILPLVLRLLTPQWISFIGKLIIAYRLFYSHFNSDRIFRWK